MNCWSAWSQKTISDYCLKLAGIILINLTHISWGSNPFARVIILYKAFSLWNNKPSPHNPPLLGPSLYTLIEHWFILNSQVCSKTGMDFFRGYFVSEMSMFTPIETLVSANAVLLLHWLISSPNSQPEYFSQYIAQLINLSAQSKFTAKSCLQREYEPGRFNIIV